MEFSETIVYAVNTETSGVVTWLDDPDIIGAIRGVLWDELLHHFVVLVNTIHKKQRWPLPAVILYGLVVVLLEFAGIFAAVVFLDD